MIVKALATRPVKPVTVLPEPKVNVPPVVNVPVPVNVPLLVIDPPLVALGLVPSGRLQSLLTVLVPAV